MRILKTHPILKLLNSYLIDSPQPSNLSYMWNFGSLLAVCLIIQIITGVTLAMHYNPSISESFNSVEHIMRDVNNGWMIRYLHANTASAFFFLVYLHIGRGLYYGSYKAPRTLVWTIGTIILVLMMATAFLGYVLPYGQMSLWGATVITNLMSAIPWLGQDIVEFIWGGFSVNNATLNRFFSLHFVLPFVLAALALMHLIALHDSAGSGNPLGISGNYDRIPFSPYYLFKDSITIFAFIFFISVFVFFMPNILGDSENYVVANPMQTPPAIVPEWYLLPFYAILRSIPNKLLGVIAMFLAILILLVLPITDLNRNRGMQFNPLSKFLFVFFVVNFLILMQLGAKHVESPFIQFGQISTFLYFFYFIAIVPSVSLINNTLIEIGQNKNNMDISITTIGASYSFFIPYKRFLADLGNNSATLLWAIASLATWTGDELARLIGAGFTSVSNMVADANIIAAIPDLARLVELLPENVLEFIGYYGDSSEQPFREYIYHIAGIILSLSIFAWSTDITDPIDLLNHTLEVVQNSRPHYSLQDVNTSAFSDLRIMPVPPIANTNNVRFILSQGIQGFGSLMGNIWAQGGFINPANVQLGQFAGASPSLFINLLSTEAFRLEITTHLGQPGVWIPLSFGIFINIVNEFRLRYNNSNVRIMPDGQNEITQLFVPLDERNENLELIHNQTIYEDGILPEEGSIYLQDVEDSSNEEAEAETASNEDLVSTLSNRVDSESEHFDLQSSDSELDS